VKILLIGSGSSGRRFIKILHQAQHQVWIYRHRRGLVVPAGCNSIDSLTDLSNYDACIISSPTFSHLQYLKIFAQYHLPTLVEKPVADSLTGLDKVIKVYRTHHVPLMVGLNLRFLPIVQLIQKYLKVKKLGQILHADLYVGQYLPHWRRWLDYQKNYSASYKLGGGVALDLIHDLDLALSFFPGIKPELLFSNKLSDLKIDTEDLAIFQTKKPPIIQVKLDYLNHIKTRQIRIIGKLGSIECDIFIFSC